MTRLLALIAFLSGTAVLAVPPAALTPDQLVEQLGSESYAERDAAMTALERSGPAVIPVLEKAVRSSNPEISRRASEVLASLRRNSDSKERLTTKTFRLSYKNIPLGTAVNDLKTRTGINLMLDAANITDPLRSVSCETGELPPWEAIAAFCQAAGLKEVFTAELEVPKQERPRRGYYAPPPPPPAADAVPVKLTDGKYIALPGSRSTAVRVLALPASFSAHRVYLGTGDVLLHFDVAPMPGLNWRDVSGIRITKVVDDAGRRGGGSTIKDSGPFNPEMFDGPVFVGGGFRGGIAMRWDGDMPVNPATYPNPRVIPVPIKVATLQARSLKLLEGTVVCEVALADQPLVTIDNIAMNTGLGVEGAGGTKMTVIEAQAAGKGGKAVLKVQTEAPSPWATSRRFNPWGAMQMEPMRPGMSSQVKGFDAAGKPVRMSTLSVSDFSNDEMTTTSVTQYSCPDGLPVKLVYTGPKPVMVEVPFKMENVPLP